jgi:hypothetical protein
MCSVMLYRIVQRVEARSQGELCALLRLCRRLIPCDRAQCPPPFPPLACYACAHVRLTLVSVDLLRQSHQTSPFCMCLTAEEAPVLTPSPATPFSPVLPPQVDFSVSRSAADSQPMDAGQRIYLYVKPSAMMAYDDTQIESAPLV